MYSFYSNICETTLREKRNSHVLLGIMGDGNVGKEYFYVSNTKQDQLQQQSIGIQEEHLSIVRYCAVFVRYSIV